MSVTVFDPRIDTTDTSSTAETTLAAQAATALEESHSAAAPVKKVFVTTQGCQMNVYDSDKMLDVLGGIRPSSLSLMISMRLMCS